MRGHGWSCPEGPLCSQTGCDTNNHDFYFLIDDDNHVIGGDEDKPESRIGKTISASQHLTHRLPLGKNHFLEKSPSPSPSSPPSPSPSAKPLLYSYKHYHPFATYPLVFFSLGEKNLLKLIFSSINPSPSSKSHLRYLFILKYFKIF